MKAVNWAILAPGLIAQKMAEAMVKSKDKSKINLYAIGSRSLERAKEYNTFRVLGFHFGEIRKLASFENIIILVMGTLLGIPLGTKILEIYCATFSNDTIKIYSALKSISIVIVCLTVFICTAFTTILLSRRIKKIDMVQALKE